MAVATSLTFEGEQTKLLLGSAPLATGIVNCCVPVWGVRTAESVTCTVKVAVEPVMSPWIRPAMELGGLPNVSVVASRTNPDGKFPAPTLQLRGGTPPVADITK
jgi:hypothetical protein